MTVMTHVTCDGKPWDLLIVMKQGNGCTEATVEMQRVLREGGCTGGVDMNSTRRCCEVLYALFRSYRGAAKDRQNSYVH